MPAIVPAEILGCIAAETDLLILVVVGTVQSNRRWLQNNIQPASALPSDLGDLEGNDSTWGSLFDEADAAVLSDLDIEDEPGGETIL
jgi:hypothetical protein